MEASICMSQKEIIDAFYKGRTIDSIAHDMYYRMRCENKHVKLVDAKQIVEDAILKHILDKRECEVVYGSIH